MYTRTIVRCTACDQTYTARNWAEGYVLPTMDGNCRCGNDTFTAVGTELPPDEPSD